MLLAFLTALPAIATGIFALVGKFLGVQQAKIASGDNSVNQGSAMLQARDSKSTVAAVLDAIVLEPLALSVSLYYAKIFFVDKVLAMGVTDPLSPSCTSSPCRCSASTPLGSWCDDHGNGQRNHPRSGRRRRQSRVAPGAPAMV
jgi:hypothetical protein